MAGTRRGVSAGTRNAFIGFFTSDGDPAGGTPTAPANGTVSDLDNVLGIKSATITTPEPDIVPVTGDDDLMAEFSFESIAARTFAVNVAAFDLDQVANIQNTRVEAFGDGLVGAEDVQGTEFPDVWMIIQGMTKKMDVGVKGRKAWSGVFIPRASARYLGRDAYTERAAASYNLSITPQLVDQTPWGFTINSAYLGPTGLRRIPFTFDNPIAQAVGRGNAILTAFPVRHPPISAAKTTAVVIPAGYSTGGVAATVSSVSTTAPYTVTLSSAPATGSKVIITYEISSLTDA